MATKDAVKSIMSLTAFARIAQLHNMASQKNYIGQLVQNQGTEFNLGSINFKGYNWQSEKSSLDKSAKSKGLSLTWPKVFETISQLKQETSFTRKMTSYLVAMFATKLSWRDWLTSQFLVAAFSSEQGEFDGSKWEAWSRENGYSIVLRDKQGEVESEFIPSARLLSALITASEELAKIANYSSHDNVSNRSADIDINKLFE